MSRHVITHGGCPDGYTSEWLLRQDPDWADATFHQVAHVDPIPALAGAEHVLIADFCYPPDDLIAIAKTVDQVTVLDHHKSAMEAWHWADIGARNLDVHFDMEHSGAWLTLEWLNSTRWLPFVEYVEDRDLWRNSLPHWEEIAPLLVLTPFTTEAWTELATMVCNRFSMAIACGRTALNAQTKIVESLIAIARPFTIAGHEVLAAPSPYAFGSTLAGELAKGRPFGAYYIDRPNGRQWGLRSRDSAEDVSVIAAEFGGGGHRNAAGFTVPWGHPLAASS